MKCVLLTIITVTRNCENEIIKTCESLNKQLDYIDCTLVEWIAIDGCSIDNTFKVVEKESEYLRERGVKTQVQSEKDKGIYDAMNKGLNIAHGKWIHMLNAGDIFYDDLVIKDVMDLLDETADVVVGSSLRYNEYYSKEWHPSDPSLLKKEMVFCHQSMFIKRNLDAHYYNIDYKYCSDYDLALRLFLAGCKYRRIKRMIICYSLNGRTGRIGMLTANKEIYEIRKTYELVDFPEDYARFAFGQVKRIIILLLPSTVRWRIKRIIDATKHGKNSNNKTKQRN